MYLRERDPKKDDSYLVQLAVAEFKVHPSSIKKRLDKASGVTVLCNDADQIAGYVCYRINGHILFVDLVTLDSNYIGKGIVSSFLDPFLKQMKGKGVKVMRGLVERNNKQALAVFKHWGFLIKRVYFFTLLIEKQL